MRCIIGNLTLPVNAALDPFLRVKLTAGYLVAAGADDQEIGVLDEQVIGPPQEVGAAVIPLGDPSPRDCVASGAITHLALVYAAAGGKLSATPGLSTALRGMAITAATGDGSHFQYIPFMSSALGAGTVGTTQLAAGAATLPKVDFTGLKVLAHAGVSSAGAVTLTGAAIGDRVVAIFGALTAGGALLAKIPGTDFEATISVGNQVQQLVDSLNSTTFVFILAPATA